MKSRNSNRLKLPLMQGETSYFPLTGSRCPICKVGRIGEPHSFVILSGGALALDKKRLNSVAAHLSGFFEVTWHGAHTDIGGVGIRPEVYFQLPLVNDTYSGQFELYVCSSKCLRKFFNGCVDEFETRLKKLGKKKPITKRGTRPR